MSIPRTKDIKDFPEVKSEFQRFLDNLSFDDITITSIRTTQPTTDSLDSGKFAFGEIAGVPTLFYRTTSGTIYSWTGIAV